MSAVLEVVVATRDLLACIDLHLQGGARRTAAMLPGHRTQVVRDCRE